MLDYIAKVGKNDRTVFILPEGTEKVEWDDIDIPDETVAILLPEGLETFRADIPNDVKYINFPSTLKELHVNFSSDSPIEALELPENLEKLDNVLFWYSPDKIRDMYVPGWTETPPEWHKSWDMFCHVHFGEYLKE